MQHLVWKEVYPHINSVMTMTLHVYAYSLHAFFVKRSRLRNFCLNFESNLITNIHQFVHIFCVNKGWLMSNRLSLLCLRSSARNLWEATDVISYHQRSLNTNSGLMPILRVFFESPVRGQPCLVCEIPQMFLSGHTSHSTHLPAIFFPLHALRWWDS